MLGSNVLMSPKSIRLDFELKTWSIRPTQVYKDIEFPFYEYPTSEAKKLKLQIIKPLVLSAGTEVTLHCLVSSKQHIPVGTCVFVPETELVHR